MLGWKIDNDTIYHPTLVDNFSIVEEVGSGAHSQKWQKTISLLGVEEPTIYYLLNFSSMTTWGGFGIGIYPLLKEKSHIPLYIL